MKTLYIEAQKDIKLDESKLRELNRMLPSPIYIVYSIQYKQLAEQVRRRINKKVSGFSQILGCSKINTKDTILLLGEARFHALNLAKSGREVFIFDNYNISKIEKEEISSFQKKEKGKISKFLISDKIGILISTKPGQEKFDEAINLKEKLKKQNKSTYFFLADNININELENFSLPAYINTACPRLDEDSTKIINYDSLKQNLLI